MALIRRLHKCKRIQMIYYDYIAIRKVFCFFSAIKYTEIEERKLNKTSVLVKAECRSVDKNPFWQCIDWCTHEVTLFCIKLLGG